MNTSGPTRPTPRYQIGDTFRLSEEAIRYHFSGAALRCFGEKYRNKSFVVEQWYDHTVPHKNNEDPHGHPCFDELTAQDRGCLYLIGSTGSLLIDSLLIESHMVYVPLPIPLFKVGDTFLLNEENFGTEYAGKLFEVSQWYDHYLPEECIQQGYDHPHGSPYFDVDASAGVSCLYDTTFHETSLYHWDMVYVPPSERHKYQYTMKEGTLDE